MKRSVILFLLVLFTIAFGGGAGFALTLGDNITINDGMPSDGIGQGGEDNECEQGMVQSQAWDLEGFFLDGFMLAMVGGYDFIDGQDSGIQSVGNFMSGDIFIDVDGDVVFGGADTYNLQNGVQSITNSFGYDYVLDLDFASTSFNVYKIDSNTNLKSVYYNAQNTGSNPWQFDLSDNSGLTSVFSSKFDYLTKLDDSEVGLSGWNAGSADTHNAALFDVSFLGYGTNFTSHFTMECGNDNLMGQGTTPVPEPGTVFLMLFGVGALFGGQRLRRRRTV